MAFLCAPPATSASAIIENHCSCFLALPESLHAARRLLLSRDVFQAHHPRRETSLQGTRYTEATMHDKDDDGRNGIDSIATHLTNREPASQGSERALALRSPQSLEVWTVEETPRVNDGNSRYFRSCGAASDALSGWRYFQLLSGVLLGVSVSVLAFSLAGENHTGTLRYMGSGPCEVWQDSRGQMLHMHEAAFVGNDRDGHVVSVGVESIASADGIQSRNFLVVKVGSEEVGLLDIHPAQEVALCHMTDDLRMAVVARPMKFSRTADKNLATVWVFDTEMGRFEDYLGVKSNGTIFVSNSASMVGAGNRQSATEASGRSLPQEWRT